MRALPPLLLLLAACGRIRFDPTEDAASLIDGEPAVGFMDADTVAGATQVPISTSGECPVVAWSTSAASIGAAWREGSVTGVADVMFAAYDAAGTLIQGPLVAANDLSNVECPDLIAIGSDFRLAISNGPVNQHVIDFVTVSGGVAGPVVSAIAGASDKVAPKLATLAPTIALTWLDKQGAMEQVLTLEQPIAGGAPNVLPASGQLAVNGPPSLTAASDRYVVTWSAGGALRMRAFGGGAGTGSEIATVGNTASGIVDVAWTGADLLVASKDAIGDRLATQRMTLAGVPTVGGTLARADVIWPEVVYTGIGDSGGVAVLSTDGGVHVDLVKLENTATSAGSRVLFPAAMSTRPSLAWTGTVYVVAGDTANGAFMKIFPPPP